MKTDLFAEYRKFHGLTSTEKLIVYDLVSYINTKKEEYGDIEENVVWPSIGTIARDCELTERAVYNNIKSLINKKVITKLDKHGNLDCYEYQITGKEKLDDIICCLNCVHGKAGGWKGRFFKSQKGSKVPKVEKKDICALNKYSKYNDANFCDCFVSTNEYNSICKNGVLMCKKCIYILYNNASNKGDVEYLCFKGSQNQGIVKFNGICRLLSEKK